jgi:integrase
MEQPVSYLAKRASTYYFRRVIPDELQPIIGRREFMLSLRTKDREEAKRVIPRHIIDTDGQLDAARNALRAISVAPPTQAAPAPAKSQARLERERARWEWEQQQDAMRSQSLDDSANELEALEPIMNAIESGTVPDAAPADIARAAKLLARHEREMADIRVQDEANKRNGLVRLEPSPKPEQNITDTTSGPASLVDPLSIKALFERFALSGTANPKTISRWRSKVKELVEHLAHDDVSKVKRADLNAWIEILVGKGLAKKTIVAGYVPAVRVPFNIAFEDGTIPVNPASALKVRAPRAAKLRDRDLTDDEAATILKASLARQPAGLAEDHACARRWVPWLMAYTGARVGELTQLRAMDIQQEDGIWFVHITPEAGSVKTAEARKVPLHSHLIEQGFIGLAKEGDPSPLFYRKGAGNVVNPASKIRGGDLAKWVRSLGVKAPQPNHGWRHRFKSEAFAVNMDSEAADIMQGHVPRVEAGKYGQRGLPRLRAEIEKLPRYNFETVEWLQARQLE